MKITKEQVGQLEEEFSHMDEAELTSARRLYYDKFFLGEELPSEKVLEYLERYLMIQSVLARKRIESEPDPIQKQTLIQAVLRFEAIFRFPENCLTNTYRYCDKMVEVNSYFGVGGRELNLRWLAIRKIVYEAIISERGE